jgi:hypothetical protein
MCGGVDRSSDVSFVELGNLNYLSRVTSAFLLIIRHSPKTVYLWMLLDTLPISILERTEMWGQFAKINSLEDTNSIC